MTPVLDLPDRPSGELDEFGPRYAAAERMARRFAAAVALVVDGRDRKQLVAVWPTVLTLLDSVGRSCSIGAAHQRGRGPRRGRTRRQQVPVRARQLHRVHVALVALEKTVDAAVAVAVTAFLATEAPGPERRAAAAEWVTALTAAVTELEYSVARLTDQGGTS